MKHLVRAIIGLFFIAPMSVAVAYRPDGGYGRWREGLLYVLAALTCAAALLVSEVVLAAILRREGKTP